VAAVSTANPRHVFLSFGMASPDFVTEKYAPTLINWRAAAFVSDHHAVYPNRDGCKWGRARTFVIPNRNGLAAKPGSSAINSRQPIDKLATRVNQTRDESPAGKYLTVPTSWNHCPLRERKSPWWERNRSQCFLIATTTGRGPNKGKHLRFSRGRRWIPLHGRK